MNNYDYDDEDKPYCPSCHTAYSDHDGLIRTCHELQQSLKNVKLLRDALVGLVGTDENLDEMESVIRLANVPQSDKVASINAIDALRKTK